MHGRGAEGALKAGGSVSGWNATSNTWQELFAASCCLIGFSVSDLDARWEGYLIGLAVIGESWLHGSIAFRMPTVLENANNNHAVKHQIASSNPNSTGKMLLLKN
jgi:hypothetical protein